MHVDERFAALRRTGDQRLRDELVLEHAGLARRLARRIGPPGRPNEDLEQVAMLALVKALDRYDPDRGVPFEAFAAPTVHGELKRYLRDRTWSVRVPRPLNELHLAVREASGALEQELGRQPIIQELAQHLGVDDEAILAAKQAGDAYRALRLDQLAGTDDSDLVSLILAEDDPDLLSAEDRALLRPVIGGLDQRARDLLRLRFVHDLTQTEIAERLGVSQVHVSRLLTRTLAQLREQLRPVEVPERARPAGMLADGFAATLRPEDGTLAPVRAGFDAWLDERGVPADTRTDLLLVLSELCANAVRAASAPTSAVEVLARERGPAVEVEVHDDGEGFRWPEALRPTEELREHGRGLAIVAALTDDVRVERRDGRTVVRCARRVRPD